MPTSNLRPNGTDKYIPSERPPGLRRQKLYIAYLALNGNKRYLGVFHTAEEAHNAYMEAAKEENIKVSNGGISNRSKTGYIGVSKIPEYKSVKPLTGKGSTLDRSSMIRVKESSNGISLTPGNSPRHPDRNTQRTKARSDNKSGLRGAMQTGTGKWMSRMWTGARYKYLGYFHSAEEAHEAYVRAAIAKSEVHYEGKKLYPEERDGAFVYVIKYEDIFYKIGKSNDPIERLATIATCLPMPPSLILSIYCSDPINLERSIHRKFSSKRVNGEWFKLDSADIEFLMSIPNSPDVKK